LPVGLGGAIVVKVKHNQKHKFRKFLILPGILFIFLFGLAPLVSAASTCPPGYTGTSCTCPTGTNGNYCCGDSTNGGPVVTSIDLGCKGKGNPILDMSFAIIRLLSDGVGIVVVASVVVAGIQYTAARNDPQNIANATNRIRATLIALLIFIFAYSILNYIIPGIFFTS
jgi:hypothetical protein